MFNNDACTMSSSDFEVDDDISISETSSSSEQVLETEDKYLIFITGSNTHIPHQIGNQ